MDNLAEWTKEQAAFLVKIGQLPAVTPAPKPTKKEEE
jgi:hypothetical protein